MGIDLGAMMVFPILWKWKAILFEFQIVWMGEDYRTIVQKLHEAPDWEQLVEGSIFLLK